MIAYLPLLQLLLLRGVLLEQIVEYFLQAVGICSELRHDILHCPFDQDSVDHTETFAVTWERL